MTSGGLDAGRLIGGRWVLEAPIGRGGMGEVWRARHAALGSPAAIKFLHAASAGSAGSRRRFLTEAKVTANLRSRHAVQVFDFGVTDDGLPYLVMELLEGETLERRIAARGRLSIEETASVLGRAARALGRAHQLGIVHRDFKPENVMLVADEGEGELVKVVDFGVAKLVGSLDETLRGALGAASGSSPSVTSTGLGTPYYMAPEQVHSASTVGPAADVWAFGVVAYECLTGRRPFGGDNVGDLLLAVLTARRPVPASSIAPVPAAFDAWLDVACAREPARRFRDVEAASSALVAALAAAVEGAGEIGESPLASTFGRPRTARARNRWSVKHLRGGLAVVAAGAALSILATQRSKPRAPEAAPPVPIAAAVAPASSPSGSACPITMGPQAAPNPAPPSSALIAAATAPVESAPPPRRSTPPPARTSARRLPPLGF